MLGALTLLSGCGGSEPDPVLDRDLTLQITLSEYRVEPANIVVQARAYPQRIHIVARDKGKLTHNLLIESQDPLAAQGVRSQPVVFLRTSTAHPGDTVTADAYLLPGDYRISCSIGNHENLGQYGKLTVLAPRTSG